MNLIWWTGCARKVWCSSLLVAEIQERIVGHILFSRMSIETAGASVSAAALAPMAVLPEHQRRGVGGQLIRHGLNLLRERGERIVIVVGHPEYYPRFGFSSEKSRCLESPFPDDAFMAMELRGRGTIICAIVGQDLSRIHPAGRFQPASCY